MEKEEKKKTPISELTGIRRWFRNWQNKRELRRLHKKMGNPKIRL